MRLRCISCKAEYEPDPWLFRCPRCGGLLDVVHDKVDPTPSQGQGVWRYHKALPRVRRRISLGEGGTPLIRLSSTRHERVYLKFEGANPTGSFKDRGMAVAVSIALDAGARAVLAASTGNTSASAAAYAARAGLRSIIVLPRGRVAKGKLFQAMLHGAKIVEVEGSFDEALKAVMSYIEEEKGLVYPVNSFNQWRLEGQKTLAYEVAGELGDAPDYVIVPVGNAGNISAIWKGFKDLYRAGVTSRLPVMIGVQARGASPLATMAERGLNEPAWFDKPETIATAIRIGRPINWQRALEAVRESGGTFIAVSDQDILEAQKTLARREGIGVEPASAAPYAGLTKLRQKLPEDATIVLVATGHSLKDPGIGVETEIYHAPTTEDAVKLIKDIASKS
ncbi:MAG: threonine synthase [Desulfurococcales archaeon]|nr:threonine synthase [Desulfurococcales archaeon]